MISSNESGTPSLLSARHSASRCTKSWAFRNIFCPVLNNRFFNQLTHCEDHVSTTTSHPESTLRLREDIFSQLLYLSCTTLAITFPTTSRSVIPRQWSQCVNSPFIGTSTAFDQTCGTLCSLQALLICASFVGHFLPTSWSLSACLGQAGGWCGTLLHVSLPHPSTTCSLSVL